MMIRLALVFTALLSFSVPSWSIGIKVSDSRANNFYMDALIWVLDKSGTDYHLVDTHHSVSSQARKVALVQRGELDILYAGTTNILEDQLLPIRFPITRGFAGLRVLIINKKYIDDYDQVKSVDDLKQFFGLVSFGWAEKEILEAVGLVQQEYVYDDIFSNLNSSSRYYFPRGVLEAYSELIDKKKTMPSLIVEEHILLKYKSAVLFFINPNNTKLADMLNAGFQKGYEDGSYQEFFYNHPLIKRSSEKAKLEQRLVIDIPNPFFPDKSNEIPSSYWHEE
jgi:hypothetical protein